MENTTNYIQQNIKWLLTQVESGSVAVPIFQRGFDWTKDQIISFMNALMNDEPFGNIILWKKGEVKIDVRNDIIKHFSNDTQNCEFLIIDGQQRTTSIIALITATKQTVIRKSKNIYYDCKEKTFINNKMIKSENPHIEASKLLDHSYSIDREDILGIEDSNDKVLALVELNKVQSKILNTNIGVTQISSDDIGFIVDTFEHINTKGKRLSLINIMHAKWYSEDINLESELDSVIEKMDSDYQIDPKTLLLSFYAANLETITPRVIYKDGVNKKLKKLLTTTMENTASLTNDWLRKAGFNNFKKLLPSTYFYLLVYAYAANNTEFTLGKKKNLRRYIKLAVINERYNSGGEGAKSDAFISEIPKFIKFINDGDESVFDWIKNTKFTIDDIDSLEYGASTVSQKYLYARMIEVMPSLGSGLMIDSNDKAHQGKLNIHHIYPKNNEVYKKKYKEKELNNIGNLTVMTSGDNKKILAKKIDDYFPNIKNGSDLLNGFDKSKILELNDFMKKRKVALLNLMNSDAYTKDEWKIIVEKSKKEA